MGVPRVLRVAAAFVAFVGLGAVAPASSGPAGATPRVGTASGATISTSDGPRLYVVRPGDTVASISARTGVSAADLRAANGIVDDRLYAGGRLVLQPGAAGGSAAGAGGGGSGTGSYTVRSGDSLWAIAQRHGVSLSALLRANDLRATSVILPGQRLRIPGASVPVGASGGSSGPVAIRMVCPVPGARFMNDWGFPRSGAAGGFHQGNDLFAPTGTPVRAPISGWLTFGSNPLGGRTFHITSPQGWVAYGAHNSSLVGSDRWVDAGEVVARVGDSGDARGGPPHLHLGLRRSTGGFLNPYPSLSAAC
jgi:LysM repeat protein